MPELEAALAQRYDVAILSSQADPARFLAEQGPRFEALVTTSKNGADGALMDQLPNVKAIAHFGVGYDTVDAAAAAKRGIVVSNTPDVLNDCVADTAMGLLLDTARGLSASERFVRRGDWLKGNFPLMTKVSGKKLGIVGLGRIGRTIAKRALGFDMEIRYHSRTPVTDVPFKHEPSLLELARWCDFLMIIVAGGPATRHLVNREVIDALGPRGFLINISRGTVVDEAALVDALVNKRIAGAGLDVFEGEPKLHPGYLGLRNVVMTPHIGSASRATRLVMCNTAAANMTAVLEGRDPPNPVN